MRSLIALPRATERDRERENECCSWGIDWAEDHHDIELMDAAGRRLAKARLPEGVTGIARLHTMIGEQLGNDAEHNDAEHNDAEDVEVRIGIETDRGP